MSRWKWFISVLVVAVFVLLAVNIVLLFASPLGMRIDTQNKKFIELKFGDVDCAKIGDLIDKQRKEGWVYGNGDVELIFAVPKDKIASFR